MGRVSALHWARIWLGSHAPSDDSPSHWYLGLAGMDPTGLHVLRHTALKLRRDAGASIEAVSSCLDHSSLSGTSVYLRRLEGETDRTWPDVAVVIGVL